MVCVMSMVFMQQLGGSSQGKHSPGCIEFGKYEINSWYSSPFPRDLAKYVSMTVFVYTQTLAQPVVIYTLTRPS